MKKWIRLFCLLLCLTLSVGLLSGCGAAGEELTAQEAENLFAWMRYYEIYDFRDGEIRLMSSVVEPREDGTKDWQVHLLSMKPDGSGAKAQKLPFVISEEVDGMTHDLSIFSVTEDTDGMRYIYAATYLTPVGASVVGEQRRWLYTVSGEGELLKSVELPESLKIIFPRAGILLDGDIWYASDNHFLRVDPAAGTSEDFELCKQGMASSVSFAPNDCQPQQLLADGRIVAIGDTMGVGVNILSAVILDPATRTCTDPFELPEVLQTGQKVNSWDHVLTVTCETPPQQAEVWNSEGVYRWNVDTGEVVPVFTWQQAGIQLSQVMYVCKAADGTYVMLSPLPESGPMTFTTYQPEK